MKPGIFLSVALLGSIATTAFGQVEADIPSEEALPVISQNAESPHMHHPGMVMPPLGPQAEQPPVSPSQTEPQHIHEPGMTMPPSAPTAPLEHENHQPMSPEAGQPETMPDHMGHMMAPIDLEKEDLTPEELMMLNMRRQGSGTGWQPTDNPMLMKMWHNGPWMTMVHWNAFLDYDNQGGPRGREKLVSQNWIMGSAMRPVGEKGMVQFRSMFSGDPFTIGKTGYPLLFQAGEAVNGRPLVDFQHPHDLFMELSAQYWHKLATNTWGFLYAAPVGEPALGPVAVPHRYSGLMNPEASLSHHVQDSTHIAFGVLTAGLVHKKWQFETSLFNGKEPDANRYDFDFGPLTSYSGRISYMPNPNWSFQMSHGHLDDPEELAPGDIDRTTASASHIKTWDNGWVATSLIIGHNFESGPDDNGVTLESLINFKTKNYLYGRVENIQRHGLLEADEAADFNISAFTLGLARDLFSIKQIPITLGAQLTAYAKPRALDSFYGDFPLSFSVYLHTNAPSARLRRGSSQ